MEKSIIDKIEKQRGKINPRYDMRVSEILDIKENSSSHIDMICNGFVFGYMRGMRAASAGLQGGK